MKAVNVILGNNGFRDSGMQRIQHTLNALDPAKAYEVIIRNDREGKTKRQLGALFGVWITYLIEHLPEDRIKAFERMGSDSRNSKAHNGLHRQMKADFLGGIYSDLPNGYIQEMWVNRLEQLGDLVSSDNKETALNANKAIQRHFAELSLSWATVEQMRLYMSKIDRYWIVEGYPLPVLDKYRKYYNQSLAKPPEAYIEEESL